MIDYSIGMLACMIEDDQYILYIVIDTSIDIYRNIYDYVQYTNLSIRVSHK